MLKDKLYRESVVHRSVGLPMKIYDSCYVRYHWHDEYEFLLSDVDGARCTVGGRQITLNKGDSLMIRGGELHSLSMSAGKSITAIVAHPRLWLGDMMDNSLDELEFTSLFICGTELGDKIYGLLHRVKECYGSKPLGCELLLRSYFCSIFTLLLESGEYQVKNTAQKAMPQVEASLFDYVHTHLAENLSLDKLCELSHYSKSYIIRLFKMHTGQTPTEYINRCRVEIAKELLKKKNVTDTAFECGFNNVSYFISVFKLYTGVTPKRYQ